MDKFCQKTYLSLITFFIMLMLVNSVNAAPNTRSPLGVNSNEVMDDDASIPFIDIYKTQTKINVN